MNHVFILGLFLLLDFMMIRPQQKQLKAHRELVAGLKKGDEVITQGGLIGKVTAVRDNELEVEIAPGVRTRVVRSTITGVVNRAAPVAANS